ncbi:alpha/beta hydrolase [Plantibacter sp. YIM 135347]|uniref:alpha/beta hydrolase n=1 Tax=Plantibacter sp. YIM 135347 TaxID=3423919 RepID=UPI003D35811E
MGGIFAIQIIDGPVPWIVFGVAGVAVLYLLVRTPTPRWVLTALLGILGGAVLGISFFALANALNLFGSPLPKPIALWAIGAVAALGLAIVNLWSSRWWRKLIAACSVVVFLIAGGMGINAYYGLDRTIGALFGESGAAPIDIAKPVDTDVPDATVPLYQSWTPPGDMPKVGKQGTQVIPTSGFDARPAGIYLPPAALVKNPPRLPFVLMMMGFPGNPDPQYISKILGDYAAKHDGLAPVVIVADQIGTKGDPACADSAKYGAAETYITTDVVNWARSNLPISSDPKLWTIAGYSNGGACAFKFAAQHPDTFQNLLVISGDEFPGVESEKDTTNDIFGGNSQKFEDSKPTNILKANPGLYSEMTSVFTVGGSDPGFIPGMERNSQAAKTAGMNTTYFVVPGAGHVVDALEGGLGKGFEVLYPVLGLSKP